nr:efflux pump aflt [Quercus suber]
MRRVYSIAMLLFLVGSAVCGSAPSSAVLISGRAISGHGSSGLLICAFSLVPYLASPEKRPICLGLISASRGIATTAGPLIGGALTERVSWRWNFYINLPLGATIYALFLYSVHPPKRQTEGFTSWKDLLNTLDLPGLTLLSGSVICLFLALQWGGIRYPWSSGRIIALLVLAALFGLAFFGVQYLQSPQGMLPTRVSTQKTVMYASFVAFCSAGAAFILTYYLPITLPWVITGTISSLVGAAIISKLGYAGAFMILGSAMGSIGSGLFTTFQSNTNEGKWIGVQIVYALGSSLASLTGLMVVQRALPLDDVPLGSGMIIFFQTLGGALFVSVAQSIFTNGLAAGLVGLGIADFDASTIATGGLDTLTQDLSEEGAQEVLAVINSALTHSWFLPVVLSCISVCGTLGVEHVNLNRKSTT